MRLKKYCLQDLCIGLVILIILGSWIVSAIGFTDASGTRRILNQMGYTDITITGRRPFAREENEYYSTGFRAISPTGQIVTGTVTKGWRGLTVRWD